MSRPQGPGELANSRLKARNSPERIVECLSALILEEHSDSAAEADLDSWRTVADRVEESSPADFAAVPRGECLKRRVGVTHALVALEARAVSDFAATLNAAELERAGVTPIQAAAEVAVALGACCQVADDAELELVGLLDERLAATLPTLRTGFLWTERSSKSQAALEVSPACAAFAAPAVLAVAAIPGVDYVRCVHRCRLCCLPIQGMPSR